MNTFALRDKRFMNIHEFLTAVTSRDKDCTDKDIGIGLRGSADLFKASRGASGSATGNFSLVVCQSLTESTEPLSEDSAFAKPFPWDAQSGVFATASRSNLQSKESSFMKFYTQRSVSLFVFAALLAAGQLAPAHAMGRSGSHAPPSQIQNAMAQERASRVNGAGVEQESMDGRVETLRKEVAELKMQVAFLKERNIDK
jgi:hypothetical protein